MISIFTIKLRCPYQNYYPLDSLLICGLNDTFTGSRSSIAVGCRLVHGLLVTDCADLLFDSRACFEQLLLIVGSSSSQLKKIFVNYIRVYTPTYNFIYSIKIEAKKYWKTWKFWLSVWIKSLGMFRMFNNISNTHLSIILKWSILCHNFLVLLSSRLFPSHGGIVEGCS